MRGSKNFRQGGSRSVWQKSSDKVFFKSSAYFSEVKWSISKKSIIFQGSIGVPGGGGGGFWIRTCIMQSYILFHCVDLKK